MLHTIYFVFKQTGTRPSHCTHFRSTSDHPSHRHPARPCLKGRSYWRNSSAVRQPVVHGMIGRGFVFYLLHIIFR